MSVKRRLHGLVAATTMLLSYVIVLLPQNASASQWTTTTDIDFSLGEFFPGMGFETVLHGTGTDAYVQNKQGVTNWIEESPGTDTGPRSRFGFTNDSAEGRLVLFGGLDGTSQWRNDTWEYNITAGEWERICWDDTPTCEPSKRLDPSMAFDNESKVAVMFGGFDEQGYTLNDTWEYDITANVWTNRSATVGPPPMFAHRMVYDVNDHRAILVGRGAESMEVWEYDAATHVWTNMSAIGGPSLRAGFALGYSYQPGHQRVVLFGGAEMMNVYDDTWEYDYGTNSWTQTDPVDNPSARSDASMTYCFKESVAGLVLWGGNSWTADTWRYSWTSGVPTWVEIVTTVSPDPPRANPGLAYDPGNDALIFYGGESFDGQRLNDTWLLQTGFNLEGKYASRYFDTYMIETQWQYIFWNQTPANVPLNTQIRLQLNASNTCDEGELPVWRGPDGTANTYYTTPGEPLWSGLSGNSCIKFLVDMITYDPLVAPRLEDVTLEFVTGGTFYLASSSPTGFSVPFDAPVYLNFSEPVDIANVFIGIIPNVTFDSPWTWNPGNTRVKITHDTNPFYEATKYDVCVWATSGGMPLPGGKKCWFFVTKSYAPFIANVWPAPNSVDVPVNSNVVISFNEPMNTSTCWPHVTIDRGAVFDGHSWSDGNKTLTMTHLASFIQWTTYTVEVPVGDPAKPCLDTAGILLAPGPAANPWSFTTEIITPLLYIEWTDPQDKELHVPVNKLIRVSFSHDVSLMRYSFKEFDSALGWKNWTGSLSISWTSGKTVSFAHTTPFAFSKPYQMQIWALDVNGNGLFAWDLVPNPWTFMTIDDGTSPPYMVDTDPANGDLYMPVWKNVTIAWHFSPEDTGGIDTSSFTFSIIDEGFNNLTGYFTTNWSGRGNGTLELKHGGFPFARCTRYTFRVLTAKDIQGRDFIPGPAENPFTFSTFVSYPPCLMWSDPEDGEVDVGLADPIILKFSGPVNTATILISIIPTVVTFANTWTEGDTLLTMDHTSFAMCTWYTLTITLSDGFPYTYKISFKTICSTTYIVETYPAQNQIITNPNDPIIVYFSEPMDNTSLVFLLVPPAGSLIYTWADNDTTVVITHSEPFADMTLYTATVLDAKNKSGGSLVAGPVANPWTFRTAFTGFYIISTDPPDGAVDVPQAYPITIVFSEPFNFASLLVQIYPSTTFMPSFPNGQTVVLNHFPFSPCTRVTVYVDAQSQDGDLLEIGPVPDPFTFTTVCLQAVSGLSVHRAPPNDVLLDWNALANATYYLVYHATEKSALWPWMLIANVSANSVTLGGHLSDGFNHFYIVRASSSGGMNSTMGVLWHLHAAPVSGGNNGLWLSLPFSSYYSKASEISGELGCGKINLVGKWESAGERLVFRYCLQNQWRGPDFSLLPGDAILIGVNAAFDWAVNGTDRAVDLMFDWKPPPHRNYYWVGLPLTGNIASASDLVNSIEGGLGPGTNAKINAMGKWNYTRQAYDFFRYMPTGWSGIDFTLEVGECVWIETTSTFAWAPPLITPEVP